jgi:osmotically-inducible protein OsmY
MASEQTSRRVVRDRLTDAGESAGNAFRVETADQQLAERVRLVVLQTGRFATGRFAVYCGDGVVRLYGQAPNWYAKQLAQESARRVGGVHRIINELAIERPPGSRQQTGSCAGDSQLHWSRPIPAGFDCPSSEM